MAQVELEQVIKDLDLHIESQFIPWSKSHNVIENPKLNDYTLNWKVTLLIGKRQILTSDYSEGIASCKSFAIYKKEQSQFSYEMLVWECENGRKPNHYIGIGKIDPPNIINVIYALISDADVLNYSSFENWAGDYGYNNDSRSAELIYKFCLEIALKLRNGIGEPNLEKLYKVAENY